MMLIHRSSPPLAPAPPKLPTAFTPQMRPGCLAGAQTPATRTHTPTLCDFPPLAPTHGRARAPWGGGASQRKWPGEDTSATCSLPFPSIKRRGSKAWGEGGRAFAAAAGLARGSTTASPQGASDRPFNRNRAHQASSRCWGRWSQPATHWGSTPSSPVRRRPLDQSTDRPTPPKGLPFPPSPTHTTPTHNTVHHHLLL